MQAEYCSNCGSNSYGSYKMGFVKLEDVRWLLVISCSDCSTKRQMSEAPRDSLGNVVKVPTGYNKFSYATGTHITGSRSYAEHLKRDGLALKQ